MNQEFLGIFKEEIGVLPQKKTLLSRYSKFKIGGPADYFFIAKTPEHLRKTIEICNKCKIPLLIIGEGTNILFDDDGFRGLILKNKVKGVKVNKENETLEAYSGSLLREIIESAVKNSLGGMELLTGIPGSLGGAIYGNAGAYGVSIGNFLRKGTVIDKTGRKKNVNSEYFQFDYRWSRLKKTGEVLLSAEFKLKNEMKSELLERMGDILKNRERKHPPLNVPCAGSFFKNIRLPDGNFIPAGFLLEKINAKKIKVGGARVYEKHANFLINDGGATCKDVLTLASILKEKVREKFGLELEEEVIYVKANPLED